jgi:hypothetical protein
MSARIQRYEANMLGCNLGAVLFSLSGRPKSRQRTHSMMQLNAPACCLRLLFHCLHNPLVLLVDACDLRVQRVSSCSYFREGPRAGRGHKLQHTVSTYAHACLCCAGEVVIRGFGTQECSYDVPAEHGVPCMRCVLRARCMLACYHSNTCRQSFPTPEPNG